MIILLSHGSRHPAAPAGIAQLAREVETLSGLPTMAAHLEFNAPSLADAARSLRSQHPQGLTDAIVVPLLFARGYHARFDVPAQIQAAENVSGLSLHNAGGLGTGADMAQLLAGRVFNRRAHLVIYAVGSSDNRANQDVERLAVRIADLTGQSTSVVFATKGGRQAVERQRAVHREVEVLPLFVTHGRLLEGIAAEPLGCALAPLISARVMRMAKYLPKTVGALAQTHGDFVDDLYANAMRGAQCAL